MGIAPSILETSWEEIEKKLKICQGFAKTIHVDFIDGKLLPDATFLDPQPFKAYSEYFNLEAHLMVENPTDYLESIFAAGFKSVVAQVEGIKDQVEFVSKAQLLGGVGLALDLSTPISAITINKEDLDQILLMSVAMGKSHQEFDPSVVEKIKELKNEYLGTIEIDGGVNDGNITTLFDAGAMSFAVNSFIFSSLDPQGQFRNLESKIDY